MDGIYFVLYFDICNYIRLDTLYNLLVLSLFLKYSIFFSSTPVLTYSIDVVFILSTARTDVLPQDLVKSRSREIPVWTFSIVRRLVNRGPGVQHVSLYKSITSVDG